MLLQAAQQSAKQLVRLYSADTLPIKLYEWTSQGIYSVKLKDKTAIH